MNTLKNIFTLDKIGILFVFAVVSFLLSFLSLWIVVAVVKAIGIEWTAGFMAAISTITMIFYFADSRNTA